MESNFDDIKEDIAAVFPSMAVMKDGSLIFKINDEWRTPKDLKEHVISKFELIDRINEGFNLISFNTCSTTTIICPGGLCQELYVCCGNTIYGFVHTLPEMRYLGPPPYTDYPSDCVST